jgi:type I restriction-modification system DNA methylase subunit/REP element-mobilizing transposase RayT
MNLFNKKILNQRIANFSFPKGEDAKNISKLIIGWQKALKDSDLSKTKEKSIQGKFLNVFFEQILGYEDKTGGKEEWTLIAEPKTEVDAQTADGSIGFYSPGNNGLQPVAMTVGVIELKDAKTSLDKKQKEREKGYSPVEQGYLYATKFDRCKWIIISNFREIRLYSKARSEQFYEKFDVLNLHKEDEFKKFYFLLHKENLITKDGDSPIDDLAKKSTDQEEDISKKFYSDYKEVRRELFVHLSTNNPDIDKTNLFEKSQKILDRIVFILFCEDTANLLPKNILKETYAFGKKSRQRSDEKVWLEIKNLFMDIDEGREDIDPKINGYNGGLFKFDEILDNLHIKDDIWDNVIKLSDYDFETDLNVNILGHIFEQSISDIENLKAQLEETEQDKSKSKRKKDGIFYTPEYITKYIVENTVGKYLEENPDKLESIKILDPACGSGAFLNQAHSYLLNEYKVKHEQKILEKQKKGEIQYSLDDTNIAENNRSILLNNLFGVDLNDESVEITKLSLWLKTARKDEPLQNLDNNIKVGNSLIDDPEVAGDKAFDWYKEFPKFFKEKKLQAYMVTWVTHNSRVSERMVEYGVKMDEPVMLTKESREVITIALAEKIKEQNYNIIACNVLEDHIHIVIVSDEDSLPKIMQELKGYSSHEHNRLLELSVVAGGHQTKLWAKGSSQTRLETEEHLRNAVEYVQNNHEKHECSNIASSLYHNQLKQVVVSEEQAFAPQYEGGFDVIIGNPPYVNGKNGSFTKLEKEYYFDSYQTAQYQLETFILFIEKGLKLVNDNGYLGFIVPTSWMSKKTMSLVREYVLNNSQIKSLIMTPDGTFEDASVETVVLILQKSQERKDNKVTISKFEDSIDIVQYEIDSEYFKNNENLLITTNLSDESIKILDKIDNLPSQVSDIFDVISGIKEYQKGKGNPPQTQEEKESRKFNSNKKLDETYKPELRGKNILRYVTAWNQEYVSYGGWIAEPRDPAYFVGERILLRKIPAKKTLVCSFTNSEYIVDQSVYIAKPKDYEISNGIMAYLGILNSRLVGWYYKYKNNEFDDLFPQVKVGQFKSIKLPIRDVVVKSSLDNLVKKYAKALVGKNEEIKRLNELVNNEYKTKSISINNSMGWNELLDSLSKERKELDIEEKDRLQKWFKKKQKRNSGFANRN